MPIRKQIRRSAALEMVTLRKLLNTRMEVSAGKMIRLEMSSAHHAHAQHKVTAVSTAITTL